MTARISPRAQTLIKTAVLTLH